MKKRVAQLITRFWWGPVAILFLAQFLSGAVSSPQRSLLPVYMERDLLYSALLISILSSSRQLLGMVASLVGGTLCDTMGRRRTFVWGLSGIVAGSILFFLDSPWLVVLVYSYVGFSLGLRTVGGQGYLISAARSESLGVLSALYTWGMTLGGALGNAVAGPIVDRTSFGTFGTLAFAVSTAVVLGVAWLLPEISEPQRALESTGGLRNAFGYGDLLRRRRVLLLGSLRFLPTCYWGVAGIFIPLWLFETTQSVSLVAWYGTVSQIVASLAQWVVGRVSDRIGRRIPTLIALALLAASILGLSLSGGRVWAIYFFGTLAASSAWSMSALIPGLVSDTVRDALRGRVLGFLHLLWNGGMLVGSLTGGVLFATSHALPFQITAALNGLALVLGFRFFRRLQQHGDAPETEPA